MSSRTVAAALSLGFALGGSRLPAAPKVETESPVLKTVDSPNRLKSPVDFNLLLAGEEKGNFMAGNKKVEISRDKSNTGGGFTVDYLVESPDCKIIYEDQYGSDFSFLGSRRLWHDTAPQRGQVCPAYPDDEKPSLTVPYHDLRDLKPLE